jgi:hypothetical protein
MKKYSILYVVEVPGMWWSRKQKKWINSDSKELLPPYSNTRCIRTCTKAFKHFKTLPSGATLTRYFKVKGQRKAMDWVKI